MKHIIYNLTDEACENPYHYKDGSYFNYRFMEPPIIIYFITTMDEYGNKNVAPISLGTFIGSEHFSFSLFHENTGRTDKDKYTAFHTTPRDTSLNLDKNEECVISYCTKRQLAQMRITGCPLPTGIDEGEVAGFNYYPSENISVPCIEECPVNMEAEVVHTKIFRKSKLYVCRIIAVHVDKYYDKLDKKTKDHPGLILTDPIFEVYQEDEEFSWNDYYDPQYNLRMKVATMGADTPLMTEPSKIGPRRRWLGTFEIWMQDELEIGIIDKNEHDYIMELYESWKKDRNPKTNGKTKKLLTDFLKDIIWKRNLKK